MIFTLNLRTLRPLRLCGRHSEFPVAALPRWVLRGESSLCELCVFARDKSGSRRQMFLQKLHPPVPRQAIGFRDIFFRMVRVHKRVSGVLVNVKFVGFAMLGQLGVE